ncbi:preprotein translocase subunit SecG [Sporomusaceae bacterium BoRhaA]|uniref:preprotein translocase subunit SecG n=1 Tax=Pelorhabdus rhamnosifermentans TaxID=2772457 RepID=UPI001C06371D|nr:preprotein translocase subunit SecG [Pelorhabdus rhamnosifermentans]MBU2699246.1 preprotein translocase subunit SecG [Pelorhabdus rhamnosifermentans]
MFTALMFLEGLICVALIAAVVMQSSKSAGMGGSVGGGADAIFGGKKKGLDELLSRATMILGGVFAVVTMILVKLSQ